MPFDEICRGDRLILELTDGEGGAVGGYFLPERHLDTGSIAHGCIEDRFCNRDILAGTLGEFCDKGVELLCIVVHQRSLHRFVTGMECKYWRVDTVAGNILDIFVMHDRIDQAVAKEIFVHVIEDLLTLDRAELDPEICQDIIDRIPELAPRFFLWIYPWY